MNKEQLYAAQTAMIEWLSDPHELGKKPFKIECAGEFDFNEMHYYIFKFKASLLGKWLVGVCGGFEDDDLEPCGHMVALPAMPQRRNLSGQEILLLNKECRCRR